MCAPGVAKDLRMPLANGATAAGFSCESSATLPAARHCGRAAGTQSRGAYVWRRRVWRLRGPLGRNASLTFSPASFR
jgi:hypothetical protein